MGKAKLNKKLTSLILILALVATIIPTSVYGNLLVSKNTKTLKTAKAVRMAAVDSAAGGSEAADEAYISKLAIISKNGTVWGEGIETGTPKFDENDERGNDSSKSNDRVRSYDSITYNVATEIQSRNNKTFAEGRVGYKVTVDDDDEIQLGISSMGWVEDLETKKENGKKIYTFYRNLPTTNGAAIPGGCTVPIVLEVGGKGEGDIVQPTIESWVEGYKETVQIVPDEVKVTSVPKYNIQLVKGTCSQRGTFDFSTATYNKDKNKVEGYEAVYGIVLQLRNDDYDKGIKGVELPKGDITFDVDFNSTFFPTGGTLQNITETYTPLLFSTDENKNDALSVKNIPASNDAGDTGCYNSGIWSAVQNGSKISFTVKDYKIDMSQFPKHDLTNSNQYNMSDGKVAIGCFASCRMKVIQPTTTVDGSVKIEDEYNSKTGEVQINATVDNMKAVGVSDTETTKQTVTTDDNQSFERSLVTDGKRSQIIYFSSNVEGHIHYGTDEERDKNINDGSDALTVGSKFAYTIAYAEKEVSQSNINGHSIAVNQLVKFDDSAIEFNMDRQANAMSGRSGSFVYNAVFAAKPDKTGWNHKGLKPDEEGYDDEMLDTKEEDLVYFTSLEELENQGYTCVGMLYEWRGCNTGTKDTSIETQGFIQIKKNFDITKYAYGITATTNAWLISDYADTVSFEEGKEEETLKKWYQYAVSSTNRYTQGTGAPTQEHTVDLDPGRGYVKAKYDETGYIGGEKNSWPLGDSVYVVPYYAKISKQVEQTNKTERKSIYTLDNGERYVDFVLASQLEFAQDVTVPDDFTTNVYIADILPKGLTYVEGSSKYGGTYKENTPSAGTVTGGDNIEPESITKNIDGTTTLKWKIPNQKVTNGDLPSLHYSCKIGDEENPENDVTNNATLTNVAKISTDEDKRKQAAELGNLSTAGISIVKLSSFNITKTGTKNLERFGTANYKMVINNSGNTATDNVYAVDSMPVDGVNGTVMKGSYKILSMKININKIKDINDVKVYYTNDKTFAGKYASQITLEQVKQWSVATIDKTTGEITGEGLTNGWPAAWAFVDDSLKAMSSSIIDMTYSLDDAAANDVLFNSYSQETLVSTAMSKVYDRSLEGKVFIDKNKDGIFNNDDIEVKNTKVILYKKDGTKVAEQLTDENGNYKFEKLEAGEYYVDFESTEDVDLSKYKVTNQFAQGDDKKGHDDSKAEGESNTETGKLNKAKITEITLPTIDEMVEQNITHAEVKYQNLGLLDTSTETTPQVTTPKNTTPASTTKETTPQTTTPKDTTPASTTKEITPQATTPKDTTPASTTKETTPQATTPKDTTPVSTTKETTPQTTTPKDTTPASTTKETTPQATTPKDTTPVTTPQAISETSSEKTGVTTTAGETNKKTTKKNKGKKTTKKSQRATSKSGSENGSLNKNNNAKGKTNKNNNNNSGNESSSNSGSLNTAQTGEASNILWFIGIFALALGAYIFYASRRKANK